MTLETMIAYAAVLGLPLWLVVEELLHRLGTGGKASVAMPVAAEAARRVHEGARAA